MAFISILFVRAKFPIGPIANLQLSGASSLEDNAPEQITTNFAKPSIW